MLVFDLFTSQIDTLSVPSFDTTITSDRTASFIGEFNLSVASLPTAIPSVNVYPSTNFTYKRKVGLDFDVEDYPLRSAVKIFSVNGDTLGDLCSGMMISSKHVLTAAHCVCLFNTDSLMVDSLKVIPGYDNGNLNNSFGSSEVERVYVFKGWNVGSEDIAILELSHSLGYATGWVGVGFDDSQSGLTTDNFFKFSYPAATNLNIDPHTYNGDTLLYNYGTVDFYGPNNIRISGTSGIGGESGSSLLKIDSAEATSYGTLTFSNSLVHSRITNWKFYSIKEVIADALTTEENKPEFDWGVYPNPSSSYVYLKYGSSLQNVQVEILDVLGRVVKSIELDNLDTPIELPEAPGVYVLSVYRYSDFLGSVRVVKR